jgi:hypothetical protein
MRGNERQVMLTGDPEHIRSLGFSRGEDLGQRPNGVAVGSPSLCEPSENLARR